jgi:hypothetical protein
MDLEEINKEIIDIAEFCSCYYNKDNGIEMSQRLTNLSVYLSRSAVLQCEAQEILDRAIAVETEKLLGHELSATVGTNLIKGRIATENKLLKLCERMNRTITHQIDALRSQLSYLKSFND